MSFAGSTQLTMNSSSKPISKLLLRRNTTPVGPEQQSDIEQNNNNNNNDAETALLLDQELAATIATPSHKRKQSDTVALGNVDINWAALNNMEKIDQGADGDEDENEDGNVMHPFDLVSGGAGPSGGTTVFFQEQRFCSKSITKSVKMIAAVVLLAAMLSIRSSRSSSSSASGETQYDGNMVYPNQNIEDEYEENFETTGEGLDHYAPMNDWVEFYNDPKRVGPLKSRGPLLVNPSIGGLHVFENVCLTNNIDGPKPPLSDTTMRGLIYFTKDKSVANNPKRCVPCSASNVKDPWGSPGNSDSTLGHPCGMKGLHAMYATSVDDWNTCTSKKENHQFAIRNRQSQTPSHANRVRFFEETTLLLQFQAYNRESSLFDTLFTYLPHWHKFKEEGNNFPFSRVVSHSVEGCLSHSRNWFCELTHQMGAFGRAKEVMWEPTDKTLYCFKTLYYNELQYQRDLSHEGLLTKEIMDEFRDEVSRNFALFRPRDMTEIRKKDAKLGMTRPMKIILYGDEPHGKNEWKGLEQLVSSTQSMKKYHGIDFIFMNDFNGLTIAEQARAFNEADAVVMATGEHVANAIFVTDDVSFVEVGCGSQSLIGNSRFMSLILGTHKRVSKCSSEDHSSEEVCITCSSDSSDKNSFTMTGDAFHSIIDELVKSHQEKISFIRDHR